MFYLGPGSRVRVQVPEYGFWGKKLPNFLKCHKMILIFNILLQDCYWSICHVSWVIRFESGLRNIDFSQRYQVENLAQYRWDIRYCLFLKENTELIKLLWIQIISGQVSLILYSLLRMSQNLEIQVGLLLSEQL